MAYIQALLPRPFTEGPVIADWHFQPSAQLGGNAFRYRWLDADRLAIFLLDVSGHGIGSALLAASVINFLRSSASGAGAYDPAAMLANANAAYPMEEHAVPRCACFYLFSDGLFEVIFPDARDGAISDLLRLLSDRALPSEVVQRMHALVAQRPFEDDVSMLRLRFD